jgi:hypothetical protein
VQLAHLDGAALVQEVRSAGALGDGSTAARRLVGIVVLAICGFTLTLVALPFLPVVGVWLHALSAILGVLG